MKRGTFVRTIGALGACAVVAGVVVGLTSAAPRDPVPLDKWSGFHDFRTFQEDLPSGTSGPGKGTIPGTPCTVETAAIPAEFAGNYLLDCDGIGPHNETTIAVNPTDASNVIAGSHSYQLAVTGATLVARIYAAAYVTTDGGAHWTNVHPPVGQYQFTGDPVLAFDSGGNAYYFNIADHEGPGGPFTGPSVIAQRSNDGGLSWNSPVTVAKGHGAVAFGPLANVVFNDKEWGTADANASSPFKDNVYVTWTRFRFRNGAYVASPIYFSRSTDGGKTWSDGKEISGASATLCSAQIDSSTGATRCDENQFSQPVVASNGTIYVPFLNEQKVNDGEFRDQVLVVQSTDGGVTWNNPVAATPLINDGVSDYPLNGDGRQRLSGCQYRVNSAGALAVAPASAPNAGQLYYVYTDNLNPGAAGPTQTDIRVVTSTNGGATWSAPVSVYANAANQVYPWATVGSNGLLRVGYIDHDRAAVSGQSCVYGYSLSTATTTAANAFTRITLETNPSIASDSRFFRTSSTDFNTRFIGDYTHIAMAPDGAVWSSWTDMRKTITFLGSSGKGEDAVAEKTGP